MRKIADFIIEKRVVILVVISLLSIYFVYEVKDLKVYTNFADLLPQKH